MSCFEDTSRVIVDGVLEPPHVKEETAKVGVDGVDVNKNGVRDDLERFINRKFSGKENISKRKLWKLHAKAIRAFILSKNQDEIENGHFMRMAVDECLEREYKESKEVMLGFQKELFVKSINTFERIKAFVKVDKVPIKPTSEELDLRICESNLEEQLI
ncbi:MAG: hypothetical protein CME64_13280 [Halobacteriovoraceae bacterium]|nr:hypothetical protein [Halobacteriovoraceae bacterium]